MTDSGVTAEMIIAAHENNRALWSVSDEALRAAYLAMRKLDPALAISNDEGMREKTSLEHVAHLNALDLMRENGETESAWRLRIVRAALAATPSPVEDDEMIERVALSEDRLTEILSGRITSACAPLGEWHARQCAKAILDAIRSSGEQ